MVPNNKQLEIHNYSQTIIVENMVPRRKRKAEYDCEEGNDLLKKKNREKRKKSDPKKQAKHGALSQPGISPSVAICTVNWRYKLNLLFLPN